jgi:hypothetical protein
MIKLEDLNIQMHLLPDNQYVKQETTKKQIYLHHTVGGPSGENTIDIWERDAVKIGTSVCISRDGTIVQAFSSKYWAFHLGLKEGVFEKHGLPYISLDKISLGIELCSYGPLKFEGGRYKTVYGQFIKDEEVTQLDKEFRGSKYWHKYTDAQIESTRKLLLFWGQKFNIPLAYDEKIWDVYTKALMGEPGVYSHVSVRYDKSDVFPQPELIAMLKTL